MMLSSSSEDTHSPPVLMTSFRRSVTVSMPRGSMVPMSPVCR
jgi:hypothetical protein